MKRFHTCVAQCEIYFVDWRCKAEKMGKANKILISDKDSFELQAVSKAKVKI
jgi:hypothetical protein